jgi:hypothetical protein
MIRYLKYILPLVLINSFLIFPQNSLAKIKEGKVTYTSSQFVYVSFDNTNGIKEGDTLFVKDKKNFTPALTVRYLSSSSVACNKIINNDFNPKTSIYANIHNDNNTHSVADTSLNVPTNSNQTDSTESKLTEVEIHSPPFAEVSGRYSIQSYASISNLGKESENIRWRHSLMLGLKNISGSGLSFSTYTILSYRAKEWNSITSNLGKALKVYDLNLQYQFDESTSIWFGRYLNRKVSNLSVVDGVQFEKGFSFLTFGLIAGSRPNFYDFGLNSKLFEYGAYINRSDSIGNRWMENTLSYFEQTNDFKTDRRFIYFQHYNNLLSNIFLFASTEIDLFKIENNQHKNDFSLTSLYISTRYSPVREFSLSLSYDARKNVIYYETFKSIGDSIFESETRQGIRARATIRPVNNLSFNFQYGFRNSKSDPKPSRNYGGGIMYSSIPLLGGYLTTDFNRIQSSYVDGYIYSAYLGKSLDKINSDFSIGFRKTKYSFANSTFELNENALLLSFSTFALNPFSFSINYEGVFAFTQTYGRILMDLTTRF